MFQTTFLHVVFLDSSGEIGFSDNFFAKVVKKEVIKNRYFMVSLTVGGKGGGGYSYRVPGGQGVGLQGPMGSRG